MQKVMITVGAMMIASIILTSCSGGEKKETNAANVNADSNKIVSDTLNVNQKKDSIEAKELILKNLEEELKSFLISTKNTYGWETKSNNISLDSFKDGRLHIQGPDGESTMWGGKWSLKGDQLTMNRPDLEKTISVTAKISGKNLVLDNIIYNRYKP